MYQYEQPIEVQILVPVQTVPVQFRAGVPELASFLPEFTTA